MALEAGTDIFEAVLLAFCRVIGGNGPAVLALFDDLVAVAQNSLHDAGPSAVFVKSYAVCRVIAPGK